jgi:hypothetical protein
MAAPPDCALCGGALGAAELRARLCRECAATLPDEGVVVGRCFRCGGVLLHKMAHKSLLVHESSLCASVAFILDRPIAAPPYERPPAATRGRHFLQEAAAALTEMGACAHTDRIADAGNGYVRCERCGKIWPKEDDANLRQL